MITPPQEQFYPSDFKVTLAGVDRFFPNWRCLRCSCPGLWNYTIPKVDKITDQAHLWLRPRRWFMVLWESDMIAGPSEIESQDRSASPVYVAADLLSQAEHDKLARAILVTDSKSWRDQVEAELDRQPKSCRARGNRACFD